MEIINTSKIASFIWGITDDVLRDLFRRGKYPDVILPMCVIRRLDAVLEPTKEKVLQTKEMLDKAGIFAQVLAQRFEPLRGVDQLNLAFAMRRLAVGKHPDVGGDAGVVEEVQRQCNDGLQPVVLDDPAADVALALTGITREQ